MQLVLNFATNVLVNVLRSAVLMIYTNLDDKWKAEQSVRPYGIYQMVNFAGSAQVI